MKKKSIGFLNLNKHLIYSLNKNELEKGIENLSFIVLDETEENYIVFFENKGVYRLDKKRIKSDNFVFHLDESYVQTDVKDKLLQVYADYMKTADITYIYSNYCDVPIFEDKEDDIIDYGDIKERLQIYSDETELESVQVFKEGITRLKELKTKEINEEFTLEDVFKGFSKFENSSTSDVLKATIIFNYSEELLSNLVEFFKYINYELVSSNKKDFEFKMEISKKCENKLKLNFKSKSKYRNEILNYILKNTDEYIVKIKFR